jgi:hypothetical protein
MTTSFRVLLGEQLTASITTAWASRALASLRSLVVLIVLFALAERPAQAAR